VVGAENKAERIDQKESLLLLFRHWDDDSNEQLAISDQQSAGALKLRGFQAVGAEKSTEASQKCELPMADRALKRRSFGPLARIRSRSSQKPADC